MSKAKILVVDDEKNIRLTVTRALEALDYFVHNAFDGKELRNTVYNVLERENASQNQDSEFDKALELAKYHASKRQFDRAIASVKQAIGFDPSRPDAFVLLGKLQETLGEQSEALRNYRVAIDLDPTYQPAQDNLERATENSNKARPTF